IDELKRRGLLVDLLCDEGRQVGRIEEAGDGGADRCREQQINKEDPPGLGADKSDKGIHSRPGIGNGRYYRIGMVNEAYRTAVCAPPMACGRFNVLSAARLETTCRRRARDLAL